MVNSVVVLIEPIAYAVELLAKVLYLAPVGPVMPVIPVQPV